MTSVSTAPCSVDLRVLAVSHSCVVDVNQRLYQELGNSGGIDLTVVAPMAWPSDLRGRLQLKMQPGFEGRILPMRTWFTGTGRGMHLHIYPGWLAAVARIRPDVILVDEEPYALSTLQFLLAGRAIGARVLFYSKQNVNKRLPPPFATLERVAFTLATAGVALTPTVADVLRRKGFRRPITVIPHGVDLTQFFPRDPEPLRSQLGLVPPVVAYIGRLAPEKGIRDYLRLLELLYERQLSFTALCVGSGPLEQEVLEWQESCGFTSWVRLLSARTHSDVAAYYNCADVVVVPSRSTPGWTEQFGRVLIEASACGVPVVGYNSGEIDRVLAATGGGVAVPEGDVALLASQVARLLHSPHRRTELGNCGRTAVERDFGLPVIAQQLRRVCTTLP